MKRWLTRLWRALFGPDLDAYEIVKDPKPKAGEVWVFRSRYSSTRWVDEISAVGCGLIRTKVDGCAWNLYDYGNLVAPFIKEGEPNG